MELLAKFKKILYMGFRATLNFRKFKVVLGDRADSRVQFAWRLRVMGSCSCISSGRQVIRTISTGHHIIITPDVTV